ARGRPHPGYEPKGRGFESLRGYHHTPDEEARLSSPTAGPLDVRWGNRWGNQRRTSPDQPGWRPLESGPAPARPGPPAAVGRCDRSGLATGGAPGAGARLRVLPPA